MIPWHTRTLTHTLYTCVRGTIFRSEILRAPSRRNHRDTCPQSMSCCLRRRNRLSKAFNYCQLHSPLTPRHRLGLCYFGRKTTPTFTGARPTDSERLPKLPTVLVKWPPRRRAETEHVRGAASPLFPCTSLLMNATVSRPPTHPSWSRFTVFSLHGYIDVLRKEGQGCGVHACVWRTTFRNNCVPSNKVRGPPLPPPNYGSKSPHSTAAGDWKTKRGVVNNLLTVVIINQNHMVIMPLRYRKYDQKVIIF